MNIYKAFYNGKSIDVQADTSYKAQCFAADLLKISRKKQYMVSVMLLEKNGQPVIHSTACL